MKNICTKYAKICIQEYSLQHIFKYKITRQPVYQYEKVKYSGYIHIVE